MEATLLVELCKSILICAIDISRQKKMDKYLLSLKNQKQRDRIFVEPQTAPSSAVYSSSQITLGSILLIYYILLRGL